MYGSSQDIATIIQKDVTQLMVQHATDKKQGLVSQFVMWFQVSPKLMVGIEYSLAIFTSLVQARHCLYHAKRSITVDKDRSMGKSVVFVFGRKAPAVAVRG